MTHPTTPAPAQAGSIDTPLFWDNEEFWHVAWIWADAPDGKAADKAGDDLTAYIARQVQAQAEPTGELPPLPKPAGLMEIDVGNFRPKAVDGYTEQQMQEYARAALAAQATPAAGGVPDVWISEVCGPEVDDLSYGQGYRRGFNDCRTKVLAAAPTKQADADMVSVCKEDANNYCRILSALGMEEEGDPVAEVERLVAAHQADAQAVVAPKQSGLIEVGEVFGYIDEGWGQNDVEWFVSLNTVPSGYKLYAAPANLSLPTPAWYRWHVPGTADGHFSRTPNDALTKCYGEPVEVLYAHPTLPLPSGQAEAARDGWISVKERLPEFDFTANQISQYVHVIAALFDGSVHPMSYRANAYTKEEMNPTWVFEDGAICRPHLVTHWKPYPAAPLPPAEAQEPGEQK